MRHVSGSRSLTAVFSAAFLGGSELFNLEYLEMVRRRGVEIDAIVPAPGALEDALRPICRSVEVVGLPASLAAFSRFDSRLTVAAAARAVFGGAGHVRRLRIAVAKGSGPICCFGFRSQLAMGIQPPFRARPLVWVVHEVVPAGPFGRLWRQLARRAETVLTYSQTAGLQPLLDKAATKIVSPSLHLEVFARQPAPTSPPRRLGLVGDLFPLKNHTGFLRVIEALRARGREVDGLIVGRANDTRPELARYAQDILALVAEAGNMVRLTSSDPASMPDTMRDIDLLLHLSTAPESFGRVCVEAMAAGRPVIGFEHGGVAEVVRHGETGFLVPVGDIEGVVGHVERLVDDSALFERLGRTAAGHARDAYGFAADRETIGDVLASLAETSGKP